MVWPRACVLQMLFCFADRQNSERGNSLARQAEYTTGDLALWRQVARDWRLGRLCDVRVVAAR